MNRFSFILFFFFLAQNLTAQSVWPGDVNNNGVVNKVDLLYLGYAFGATGEARIEQNGDWTPKTAPALWENDFPNDTNYSFADCNGDGIVDLADADIIIRNLGFTHNDIIFIPDEFPQGVSGTNPACEFINTPIVAPVDQVFNLEIALGSQALPIDSMSGFTFFVKVEPAVLGVNNTNFTITNNAWIEGDENTALLTQQQDLENVKLKVAYTKIDQNNLTGSGSIASVSFLIESDVIDLLVIDTVTFTIDSVLVLDNNLEPIPVVADVLKLAIDRDFMVNTTEHPLLSAIDLFPNPNKGLLVIESMESILDRLEIINPLGQVVFQQKLQKTPLQVIDIQELPRGMYWVNLLTKHGIKTKKIQKF